MPSLGAWMADLAIAKRTSCDHEKDRKANSECKVADVRNSEDEGGDEDVDESGFEEDDPSKVHELVVAEARNRPANENEEEDEDGNFRQEATDMQQADPPGSGWEQAIDSEADRPTTEEKSHDERRANDHGGVFSKEEKGELHRGIFSVVTADKLGFTFGKIERSSVGFREDRGGEDRKRKRPEGSASTSVRR